MLHPFRRSRRSSDSPSFSVAALVGTLLAGAASMLAAPAVVTAAPALPAAAAPALPSAPGTAAAADPLAKHGDHNDLVVLLQQLLINAGITVRGGVDGDFGSGTAAAVSEYQTRRGLTVNGTLDVPTATALGMLAATPLLAPGSRGADVTRLQQQLIAVGIAVRGGADGVYGSATAAAVSAFQSSRTLPTTGKVDAATAAILANAAAKAGTTPTPTAPPPGALLSPGNSGAAVKAMQVQLIAVGLRPKGGADGLFGSATVASLRQFQGRTGLTANGIYNQQTADALTAAAGRAGGGGGGGGGGSPGSVAIFPLPRTCLFWNTWGAPRSGGRTHQGVDIASATGTPIYAVQDGTITKRVADKPGSLGGNQIWLTTSDGTYFFHAHLHSFVAGVGVGTVVHVGDVIGYVGKTGNASIPHLHFEVHPRGGAAVNPYPLVQAVSGC